MSEHLDPLSPQNVDESIEQLSTGDQPIQPQHRRQDVNTRLIQDLHMMHAPEYSRHQQELQRVEDRLLERLAYNRYQQKTAPLPALNPEQRAYRRNIQQGSRNRMEKRQSSHWISVGLLVAALVIVLVGSLLVVPKFLHSNTMTESVSPARTPRPTPTLSIPGASTGKTLYTTPASQWGFNGFAWSPDSKRVASSTVDKAQIWDATTGEHLVNVDLADGSASSVAWSPNSQIVAVGTPSSLLLVDGQTGTIMRTYQPATASVNSMHNGTYFSAMKPASGGLGLRSVVWSPDGRFIATEVSIGVTEAIQVIDAQTATLSYTLHIDDYYAASELSWSSDGQYLAATIHYLEPGSSAPRPIIIQVWKLSTHQIVWQKSQDYNSNYPLAFQPGHDNLAFIASNAMLELWDVMNGKLVKLYKVLDNNGALAWSPDGRYLAYQGGINSDASGVKIMDISSGKIVYTYKGDITNNQVTGSVLAWSPNGKYIVSADGTQSGMMTTAKVWLIA